MPSGVGGFWLRPLPGKSGTNHEEPAGERPREREHVPAGDAEPVYEHDGLALARRPGVDAQAAGHEAATGNSATAPRPHAIGVVHPPIMLSGREAGEHHPPGMRFG